jgi:hypothetical protein
VLAWIGVLDTHDVGSRLLDKVWCNLEILHWGHGGKWRTFQGNLYSQYVDHMCAFTHACICIGVKDNVPNTFKVVVISGGALY